MDMICTDLAAVRFKRVVGNTYSIQCVYPSERDTVASGCIFLLVSGEEGVQNATGTIQGGESGRVLVYLRNVGCYREVLAYSLDANNTSAAVSANITTDKECVVNTGMANVGNI